MKKLVELEKRMKALEQEYERLQKLISEGKTELILKTHSNPYEVYSEYAF